MNKIIVTEKIADKGIEALQASGMQVDVEIGIDRERLLRIIENYDAIVVRSVTKINEEFYQHAKNLKVVGRAGNGVDNIDMEGATKRGIIVVNTPEANTVSAAEHTIGLLIASCRNIPQANSFIKNRNWDRSAFKGVELLGKTLGVVGLGRIGSLVATRMQSFGMKVIAYDPYITDERFEKFSVEKKACLEDLVKEADFITVHTPKTEETLGMIGEKEFKIAKRGVRVVNCARGGIIDEDGLVWGIKEGIVASAGMDVLVDEPNTTSPLLDLDNVIITPHLGADTVEAQNNVGVTIAHEVISALKGEMVPNAVNLPTLQHQELEALTAYLQLGEVLGKLYHQLEKEAIEKIEIIYSGTVAEMETSAVTLAVLKGIFEPILKERVNYVNARLIAQNRGISVTESKKTVNGSYMNLIRLNIISKDKTFTTAGTVFAKKDLRIVDVDGFEFDVTPTPYMLVANNMDKPGMIGQIGTLLGASKVNIATMQVSRNFKVQQAMMFLTVDSDVTRETLNLISNVEGILKINFLKL
ncbi:phosphoglycerate dehydrogenase [Clostridium formicaceticum]|uniref:D-3-phosphoglycerate dehydrogenase n=1 Tax=Clostridium formicaceticum TaxID=1497 RepID=A0AAC9RPN9_9CLOT|nr:phosphoglycerate dehydrogenase [Clostridium formicaceticum]AOY74870.1 phosphoglycerate dehydrogenase [Clostridium formicaceticum]ARE89272.1 D-3-phosphoglycerate dehydrogenase [Clostridium formicaceticum]